MHAVVDDDVIQAVDDAARRAVSCRFRSEGHAIEPCGAGEHSRDGKVQLIAFVFVGCADAPVDRNHAARLVGKVCSAFAEAPAAGGLIDIRLLQLFPRPDGPAVAPIGHFKHVPIDKVFPFSARFRCIGDKRFDFLERCNGFAPCLTQRFRRLIPVFQPCREANRCVFITCPPADVHMLRLMFIAPVARRRVLAFPVVSARPEANAEHVRVVVVVFAQLMEIFLDERRLLIGKNGRDVVRLAVFEAGKPLKARRFLTIPRRKCIGGSADDQRKPLHAVASSRGDDRVIIAPVKLVFFIFHKVPSHIALCAVKAHAADVRHTVGHAFECGGQIIPRAGR